MRIDLQPAHPGKVVQPLTNDHVMHIAVYQPVSPGIKGLELLKQSINVFDGHGHPLSPKKRPAPPACRWSGQAGTPD
jgi:hypothetical protein